MTSPVTTVTAQPVVPVLAPARGQGRRPSVLDRLGDSTLLERLLVALREAGLPRPLILTTTDHASAFRAAVGSAGEVIVCPTPNRAAALASALEHSPASLFLIHDADRALTPVSVMREVLTALTDDVDAVVPTVDVTDSVKEVQPQGLRNVDRSTLTTLQCPRLLRRDALQRALEQLGADSSADPLRPICEISAALDAGARVRTVHGSHSGFAVNDRLSLWQAQIALGIERDTSHRHGLGRHR